MNTLVLCSFAPSLVLFRRRFIKELVSRGCLVKCSAPAFSDAIVNDLKKIGVEPVIFPLSRTGLNPITDFFYIRYIYKRLKEDKTEILFAYTVKPVIFGLIAAWLAGVPKRFAMITGAGYAFGGTTVKQKCVGIIVKVLYRFSLKRANRVFFQNRDDRDLFLENRLVNADSIAVINGSGIDLKYFIVRKFPSFKPIVFLMVARLLRAKGVVEYLEAAKIASKKLPNARWVLVGPIDQGNPDSVPKAEFIAKLESSPVKYFEWTDDVRQHLQKCHVFVLPSYREGLPRTVLEAMATGRPIITTDVPGCRETVTHGINGLLVPSKDMQSLANAMVEIARDEYKIQKMGVQSRYIAEEKFNSDLIARQMVDFMALNVNEEQCSTQLQ